MNYLLSDINFQAATLAAILLDVTLKGLVLLVGAFLLSRLTYRKTFHGSRYWFIVLILLLGLAAINLSHPAHPPKSTFPLIPITTPEPDFSFAALPVGEQVSPWMAVGLFWATGLTFYILRMVVGLRKLKTLTKGGENPGAKIETLFLKARQALNYQGRCQLQIHPDCAGPLTFYSGGPWILLPPGSEDWDAGALEAALIHELVHIRRKDFWWSMAGRILSGLFWFLPPVWFLMRRFRLSQELECDRAVVADGGVVAEDYAAVLLNLSRNGRGVPVLATALGSSSLETRITHLLFPGSPRARTLLGLGVFFMIVAPLLTGLYYAPPLAQAEPNFFKLMHFAADLQTWEELEGDKRLRRLPLAWPVEAGLGWMENCRFPARVGALSYPVLQDGVRIYADHQYRVLSAGEGWVINVLGNPGTGFTVTVRHDHGLVVTYSALSKIGAVYPGKDLQPGDVVGRMTQYPGDRFGFELSIRKNGKNIDPAAFVSVGYERLVPPVYGP